MRGVTPRKTGFFRAEEPLKELAYVTLALGLAPWGPVFLAWGLGLPLVAVAAAGVWMACWYTWLWRSVWGAKG